MEDSAVARRPRRYKDEDTTPTSDKEIKGWYSYSMAAEVFSVVGVGSFLPVTLEQLARENGVLWSDRTTPCIRPLTAAKLLVRAAEQRDEDQCLIHMFGTDMTTASFAMYTFATAVFVQGLVLISFSSFADHGDNRKKLLLVFGFTGAIVSMSFMLVFPSMYMIAPILAIIGVTCLGSSFVLLNSFLPLLAANHPSIHHSNSQIEYHDKPVSSSISAELQLSTKVSSKGVGLGYAAALLVQCFSILILSFMNKMLPESSSKTLPLRCILLVAGLWWFAFTIPSALWLRKRPGPPLETKDYKYGLMKYFLYVGSAWASLWRTVKVAFRLKQAAIFLLAWFLLSDGTATVSGIAILFARTELKISTVGVALLSITATVSGIAGSIMWPMLSKRFRWRTNRTIVACMILMEMIPLYGLLGYVPFIQRLGWGGLQQAWEIYPLGVVHGLVMGGLSSYCRSFFGLLIPPGHEVAFYALFAVTDKGSSAFGPALVGRIIDATGQIRPAFIFIAILIALPMPIMWIVDAESGQQDAISMSKRLQLYYGGEPVESEMYARPSQEIEEAEAFLARE